MSNKKQSNKSNKAKVRVTQITVVIMLLSIAAGQAATTDWVGKLTMADDKDQYTPRGVCWLPDYEIGLRSDGVLVWRKVGAVAQTNKVSSAIGDLLSATNDLRWIDDSGWSHVPFRFVADDGITNGLQHEGLFWIEWVVETNDTPRNAIGNILPKVFGDGSWITNSISWWFTNGVSSCPKEHLDTSEHTETRYVSRNLISYLVWRGQTNRHYLESIPVRTETRKWHWEKRQVYTE